MLQRPETLDPATLTPTSTTVMNATGPVEGVVDYDGALIFTPSDALALALGVDGSGRVFVVWRETDETTSTPTVYAKRFE